MCFFVIVLFILTTNLFYSVDENALRTTWPKQYVSIYIWCFVCLGKEVYIYRGESETVRTAPRRISSTDNRRCRSRSSVD